MLEMRRENDKKNLIKKIKIKTYLLILPSGDSRAIRRYGFSSNSKRDIKSSTRSFLGKVTSQKGNLSWGGAHARSGSADDDDEKKIINNDMENRKDWRTFIFVWFLGFLVRISWLMSSWPAIACNFAIWTAGLCGGLEVLKFWSTFVTFVVISAYQH